MATSALTQALSLLGNGQGLSPDQTSHAFSEIIDGQAEPVVVAAFLTALKLKGESADELSGAVQAVRSRMTVLEIPDEARPVLDTCGTGGDGANTVNISTAAAIVVAACGVRVAKHGNRSASGNSGSAEVLIELGVKIEAPHSTLVRCLGELGITFLFAPSFHPLLRHAAPIRKQLPFRTLFNLVGPLVNPARPEFQLLGTTSRNRSQMMSEALRHLNELDGQNRRAYVIAGGAGLDEVSLQGVNLVEAVDGPIRQTGESWEARDFGLPCSVHEQLRVSGPVESASRIRALFGGDSGPVRDVVLANAAAALKLTGRTASLTEGVAEAARAIDRGDAGTLLQKWARLSNLG